jgi:hypothetical protein
MLYQPGVAEHAIDAGGADRDDIAVEHHERESPVAFESMVLVELDDGSLFPRLQPPVAWHQGIVLVGHSIASFPVVELAGRDPQPGDESGDGDLGSLRPSLDQVNDAVAGIVGNPCLRSRIVIPFLQTHLLSLSGLELLK